MADIASIIDKRLKGLLSESAKEQISPSNPSYDRQYAEDILFHTIGPLAESPRWVDSWSSPSKPPEDFTPHGPAPKWTEDELVFAMAGDPQLLFSGRGNPRSPRYGNKGGSPLFRTAQRVARIYNRATDSSFIEDLYSNGFVALTRMMQPGFDKSQSAFISYALRNIKSAMEHGIGGELRTSAAAGFENELGQKGIKALLDETDPEEIRRAANVVKGKYREEASHDKHDDNPFGIFSAPYYQTVMQYADAVESGDERTIASAREGMKNLLRRIEDYTTKVGGASTGLGQAIDTPDRKTSIGIASMDAPTTGGDDDTKTMASNIPSGGPEESFIDPEAINYILDIALRYDLGKILASSEKYNAMAKEMGAKKIGGQMTVNELRYTIRTLGNIGSDYPGKGVPREKTNIPRDKRGWWQPGEDPEIEPLPTQTEDVDPIQGGLWHSIWKRNGYGSMGPTAIADEMTQETKEFKHYGIPTHREIRVKQKKNKTIEEVVSKVAVANTLKAATVKLKIISDIYSDELGIDEDAKREGIISEDIDVFDRSIISECANAMVTRINKAIVLEASPPGWKGSVKAMKKHDDIDNPYALAWSMKNKGANPHYKDKEGKPEKKEKYKEDMMKPVDAFILE